MNDSGNTWAIVLSTGTAASSLRDSLQRARAVATARHICVLRRAADEPLGHGELRTIAPRNLLVLPEDRGSAAAVLLGLLHVLQQDSAARIVVLSAEHHVEEEAPLVDALRRALQVVNLQRDKILLLGMVPGHADTELGYIVPGRVNGPGTHAVQRMVERPSLPAALALLADGALWNSLILVADATTLSTLLRTRLPRVYAALQACTDWPARLPETYRNLPWVDVAQDVLCGAEPILRVLAVEPCGWSAHGTTRRPGGIYGATGAQRTPMASGL